MRIGCSLPTKTFMPEYVQTGREDVYDPFEILRYGYQTAGEIGYAYIEAALGVVRDLSVRQLQYLADQTRAGEFRLEYCNCFVPPQIPLCTAESSAVEEFVADSMQRMDTLDVRRIVFGSGGARRRPPEMEPAAAKERIVSFLRLCDKIGGAYGITTVIEPLNSTETNMITTVAEGAQWVRELALPHVRLLGDLFHMDMEKEDPAVLLENRDILAHLHASEAPGRSCPGKFGGQYLRRCGELLRKAEWDKDITVECVFDDFESEARSAFAFMEECFK